MLAVIAVLCSTSTQSRDWEWEEKATAIAPRGEGRKAAVTVRPSIASVVMAITLHAVVQLVSR